MKLNIGFIERMISAFITVGIVFASVLSCVSLMVFMLFVLIASIHIIDISGVIIPSFLGNLFVAGFLPLVFGLYLFFLKLFNGYFDLARKAYFNQKKKKQQSLVDDDEKETYTLIDP